MALSKVQMHLFMISLLLVQAVPTPSALYERYNQITRFDHHFSKYSKRYFGPAFDWRYFKAQAVAESRLEENATSVAGAVGIMQVMPQTFKEIRQNNLAIQGGARSAAVEHCCRDLVRPEEFRHVESATVTP